MHRLGSPVSYSETSFLSSDEACNLISFGTAGEDDDDDVMSTAASDSGDWSCQEFEAQRSEVTELPAAVDEELLSILSETIKDLGVNWSPPEQPARFLQQGHEAGAHPETRSIVPGRPRGNLAGLLLPLFERGPDPEASRKLQSATDLDIDMSISPF